jgi:glycine cleavage system H protein
MNPDDLKYTEQHEWIGGENNIYVVGMTAYAAEQLGDVTYIELPDVGLEIAQGAEVATIESVKAASEIYAPVSGRVAAVNTALEEEPGLVNESPYDKGWLLKLDNVDASQMDSLMDAAAYARFIEEHAE